jgi:glycosyltransferase involved in cell wall biosynthesis
VNKLPISAIVVGYNEGHFLEMCFKSISFCDQIVFADLGSTDNSVRIAEKFVHQIYHRDRASVPSCEMVQAELVNQLNNEWIIFIDPDERLDESLQKQLIKEFQTNCINESIGGLIVPWQFYFKNRKLKGTPWGGMNKKYFLVNRSRFVFKPIIHYGRNLLPGFSALEISFNGQSNVLHHYWMSSLRVFVKKHMRYLKNEGKDQYNAGIRSGYKKILYTPFTQFYFSFITKKGYKDYFLGFILSLFWSFYQTYIAVDIFLIEARKSDCS